MVKCQVCELAVQEAKEFAEENQLRSDEDQVTDMVEHLCSVKKKEGRWLMKLDLYQEEDELKVLKNEDFGECHQECLTVQRACTQGLKGADEKLVSLIVKGSKVKALKDKVC